MTTYERLISELSGDIGVDLAPDRAGVTMLSAEDRVVLIRADETNEQELTIFTTVAKAPEGGFPCDTLARALELSNTLKAAPAEPAANVSPSCIGDGFIVA